MTTLRELVEDKKQMIEKEAKEKLLREQALSYGICPDCLKETIKRKTKMWGVLYMCEVCPLTHSIYMTNPHGYGL